MTVMIFQSTIENPNKFFDYEFAMNHGGIYPKTYRKVYQGRVPARNLEEVFMYLNYDRPDGYIGHSLSVSDIIFDMTTGKFFYCDSFGFKEIEFEVNAYV